MNFSSLAKPEKSIFDTERSMPFKDSSFTKRNSQDASGLRSSPRFMEEKKASKNELIDLQYIS